MEQKVSNLLFCRKNFFLSMASSNCKEKINPKCCSIAHFSTPLSFTFQKTLFLTPQNYFFLIMKRKVLLKIESLDYLSSNNYQTYKFSFQYFIEIILEKRAREIQNYLDRNKNGFFISIKNSFTYLFFEIVNQNT